MVLINKKKIIYPVSDHLRKYLIGQTRAKVLPIQYKDLARYQNTINLYDREGQDTLWETVLYDNNDVSEIHTHLKKTYTMLKTNGDESVMEHLYIDRIDICSFGNTLPYRIRVVNRINDNFDYFYVKKADASRIYGLELEHLLSPNRINFIVHGNTLIEEHIVGIPGDQFIRDYLKDERLNEIRLSKEFVKFNERCFIRLLGDMHSSNFVVDITPDFDEVSYRLRAIDFDQQSYEGNIKIYQPKYFKQNNPIIKIGMKHMTPETMKQYQAEEKALMNRRVRAAVIPVKKLVEAMRRDVITLPQNFKLLKDQLAEYYDNSAFLQAKSMGDLLRTSLLMVTKP